MSTRLAAINVITYPWERPFVPKYQIYIDFRRLDGKLGGDFLLQAMWWVVETIDDKRLMSQRSSIIVPTGSDSFESYVVSQNIALEKLSIEIADSLIHLIQ
jgi:uncharacterized lipoprotein YmbA